VRSAHTNNAIGVSFHRGSITSNCQCHCLLQNRSS
jgi:hypothetical protein